MASKCSFIHKRRDKHRNQTHTHPLLLLALLILVINKIQAFTPSPSSNHQYPQLNEISKVSAIIAITNHAHKPNENSYKHKRKPRYLPTNCCFRTQTSYLSILLIIAGDVHTNPGPKILTTPKSKHNCTMCTEEIQRETSLQCETCNKWCHLRCTGNTEENSLQNRKFEWICPTKNCLPNHNEAIYYHSLITSPNRYSIPQIAVTENNPPRPPLYSRTHAFPATTQQHEIPDIPYHQPPAPEMLHEEPELPDINTQLETPMTSHHQTVTSEPQHQQPETLDMPHILPNHSLLNELTKISTEDYIGKELCSSCYKEVKHTSLSILCDICDRWIHRKCSDMTLKEYKENQKKKHFSWKCSVCRPDDKVVTEKPDITILKENELPESLESVQKGNNQILVLSLNFRSIMNKEEELEYICSKYNPDIICITETWMDESVAQAYLPAGYKVIRKDRSKQFKQKYGRKKGGGIAIYYKSELKVEKKTYLTDEVEEILWVQVKTKESFMLGTVYRNEYTDILSETDGESKLEENVRKAQEISHRIIINGDFNIDTSDTTNCETEALTNLYNTYNLTQLIKKPTRTDKKSGRATVIDHIWANEELQLIEKTGTFLGVSDHFGTYMVMNMQKPPPQKEKITYRCYKNYSIEAYNEDLKVNLQNSLVEEHIIAKNVNAATEELIKVMQQTADVHAPIKETEIGVRKKPVTWFTAQLEEMITVRNNLLSDYYFYYSNSFKSRLKTISNSISHLKRKLKKKYIEEKLNEAKGNSKQLWKIINQVTNRTKSHETVEPDMMTQEKANRFNKYFATIGSEIQKALNTINPTIDFSGLQGFNFKMETEEAIMKLIDKIKLNVATGNDNISSRLIKDAKFTITPLLTQIINLGYETSIFPECMKQATIKALHKKEDSDDISNYRPISILPTLSKVLERAATNQLISYLEAHNLISTHQHAYRTMHSTKTCLFEVVNYIYRMLDAKRYTAVASLDLSKAFDSISHTLLLQKLSKLGLSEQSLHWVQSYLTARKQRTKFKNFTSTEEDIISGVPQGSIIGPLLFLCFTNDLAEHFRGLCKLVAYADDTQLIIDASNLKQLEKKIEQAITTAQRWYSSNSMKNNIGKTEVLVINTRRAQVNMMKIRIKDEGKEILLKPKNHIKILGIFLDDQLNWTKQVSNVKKKSMNATRNIHRINHLIPYKLRIHLYTSLVCPQFDYADIVWGGCGVVNSQRIQTVQNFAVKSITGNKKSDSATKSFQKLKFLKLNQRRYLHEATFTHKSLLFHNPDEINSTFIQQISTGNTRQSTQGKLILPKHTTSKYENSPVYRCIKSWNSCPPHIPIGNEKTHKSSLHKHLIQQSYQSI